MDTNQKLVIAWIAFYIDINAVQIFNRWQQVQSRCPLSSSWLWNTCPLTHKLTTSTYVVWFKPGLNDNYQVTILPQIGILDWRFRLPQWDDDTVSRGLAGPLSPGANWLNQTAHTKTAYTLPTPNLTLTGYVVRHLIRIHQIVQRTDNTCDIKLQAPRNKNNT